MFPLEKREISGYRFDVPTFYNAHHIGVDYLAAVGDPLFAPFRGTVVEAFTGPQGGKTIWFKPSGTNEIIRFLHLDKILVPKGAEVVEGDLIGRTGNTGKLTRGPHLHLDISKGSVVLAWPGNFIDPEEYKWETTVPEPVVPPAPPVQVPIYFWVTHLYRANWRLEPTTKSAVMVTYNKGSQVECVEVVEGEEVTVNGVTSNKWYKSRKSGWFISATVAKQQ